MCTVLSLVLVAAMYMSYCLSSERLLSASQYISEALFAELDHMNNLKRP